MRTTRQQADALWSLAHGREGRNALCQRVQDALAGKAEEPWTSALHDLLTILGDRDATSEEAPTGAPCFIVAEEQLDAMRRNWRHGADEDEVRNRIFTLRTLYDWPALRAVIEVCPGVQSADPNPAADIASQERVPGRFQLNDLFNVLDMHGQSGHGFRVMEERFLTPQQVLGARNALRMLLHTMLYIDWQYGRVTNSDVLRHHYEFAIALGRRMQGRGLELAESGVAYDSKEFYMGDASFVSLNYDPIALWCQFVANRDMNHSPSVPHVGHPACRLQIFHDLGHFVAGPRVQIREDRGPETPWHPMNETSALRLNDPDHRSGDRIRISKFLLPHGCLWWRECPDCGKLSSYMGDTWERDSPTLIPPPPLQPFVGDHQFQWRLPKEQTAWETGEVDARACVHCHTLTYAHHTQTVMQSSYKETSPPFLDEIKRDLRVAVQHAGHIVLMGYTMPLDDVDYRAFLAARRTRADSRVRCSVVVGTEYEPRWFAYEEWSSMLEQMNEGEPPRTTLEAARDLFGGENVRFYGAGIPSVFLDGDMVTADAVEQLLTWESP